LLHLLLAGLLVIGAALAVYPSQVVAAGWRVEQDGSGDYSTLQPAVDAAASGDTILIGPGWYQDLHLGSHGIYVMAHWTSDKDLAFIGESPETVKLGPELYNPIFDGPVGIFTEGPFKNSIVVQGISFVNFYSVIVGTGNISVYNCWFDTGELGIVSVESSTSTVRNCIFNNFENVCNFYRCSSGLVEDCQFGNGRVYFGNVSIGNIINCRTADSSLANYSQSNGSINWL